MSKSAKQGTDMTKDTGYFKRALIYDKEGAQMGQQGSFTPGPWQIVDGHYIESKFHNICRIYGPQTGRNGRSKLLQEEADANARLIASAPELLEICKSALSYTVGAPEVYKDMRAIIARTEGRAEA